MEVFPPTKLYALDIKVHCMDPGWPIQAKPPAVVKSPAIHVNPNFFKTKEQNPVASDDVQAQLREKHRTLLELQKRKLELELVATKKQLEDQEREITLQATNIAVQGSSSNLDILGNETPLAAANLGPSRSLINTPIPPNVGPIVS